MARRLRPAAQIVGLRRTDMTVGVGMAGLDRLSLPVTTTLLADQDKGTDTTMLVDQATAGVAANETCRLTTSYIKYYFLDS